MHTADDTWLVLIFFIISNRIELILSPESDLQIQNCRIKMKAPEVIVLPAHDLQELFKKEKQNTIVVIWRNGFNYH